jgi:hypothetical protein
LPLHRRDDAEESLLEQVVCRIAIAHHTQQVAKNPLLVALHEYAKRSLVSVIEVSSDELLVS